VAPIPNAWTLIASGLAALVSPHRSAAVPAKDAGVLLGTVLGMVSGWWGCGWVRLGCWVQCCCYVEGGRLGCCHAHSQP